MCKRGWRGGSFFAQVSLQLLLCVLRLMQQRSEELQQELPSALLYGRTSTLHTRGVDAYVPSVAWHGAVIKSENLVGPQRKASNLRATRQCSSPP